jgi:phosphoheptose isomerase
VIADKDAELIYLNTDLTGQFIQNYVMALPIITISLDKKHLTAVTFRVINKS